MTSLRACGLTDRSDRFYAARNLQLARRTIRRRISYIRSNPLLRDVPTAGNLDVIVATWCEAWALASVAEAAAKMGPVSSSPMAPVYERIVDALDRKLGPLRARQEERYLADVAATERVRARRRENLG